MEEKKEVPEKPEQSVAPPTQQKARDWITLERERSFGSITGSELRVWGEK